MPRFAGTLTTTPHGLFPEEAEIRLTLVRHAETFDNERHVYLGDDDRLSPRGHEQARCLARRLSSGHFDCVARSPTIRTEQTLEPLLELLPGLRVQVHEGLREGAVGEWEGGEQGQRVRVATATGVPPWEVRPPDGESWVEVERRAADLLTELVATCAGSSVLVVGHGRLNSLALKHLEGRPWSSYNPKKQFHTGVTTVLFSAKRAVVTLREDLAHLTPELTSR